MAKSKLNLLRKWILSIVLLIGTTFPKSGLIYQEKSVQEMEEDGEVHLGI